MKKLIASFLLGALWLPALSLASETTPPESPGWTKSYWLTYWFAACDCRLGGLGPEGRDRLGFLEPRVSDIGLLAPNYEDRPTLFAFLRAASSEQQTLNTRRFEIQWVDATEIISGFLKLTAREARALLAQTPDAKDKELETARELIDSMLASDMAWLLMADKLGGVEGISLAKGWVEFQCKPNVIDPIFRFAAVSNDGRPVSILRNHGKTAAWPPSAWLAVKPHPSKDYFAWLVDAKNWSWQAANMSTASGDSAGVETEQSLSPCLDAVGFVAGISVR